jgi:hypothetical protein
MKADRGMTLPDGAGDTGERRDGFTSPGDTIFWATALLHNMQAISVIQHSKNPIRIFSFLYLNLGLIFVAGREFFAPA